MIASKEAELQQRRVELETAEHVAARLTHRLTQSTTSTATTLPTPSSHDDAHNESQISSHALGNIENRENIENCRPQQNTSPHHVIAAKGAARLARLEGIVAAIAHSGSADAGALAAAQRGVITLKSELAELQARCGSGAIDDEQQQRDQLSEWETSLGRCLEAVVEMQRATLHR